MPAPQLTNETISQLAAASGMPIPTDHLPQAADLLRALMAMEETLQTLDLTDVEPEWRWDARWGTEDENQS